MKKKIRNEMIVEVIFFDSLSRYLTLQTVNPTKKHHHSFLFMAAVAQVRGLGAIGENNPAWCRPYPRRPSHSSP
jgi:hypothetical protein